MRQVRTLVHKEVLDILRDRKTLVMMVLVPILLYPLLIIGMALAFSAILQSQADAVHVVGYAAENAEFAGELQELYEQNQDSIGLSLRFVPGAVTGAEEKDERADVRMEVAGAQADGLRVTLSYTSSDQASADAEEALRELLELYGDRLMEERLSAAGLDESFLHPIVCESEDASSVSESFGMNIGGYIGMMLIITLLLGALYPAIDATAGEKERGTLETLLTLPVTNFQIILSKYISVAMFACVTAVLSLLSLGGSVLFLMFGVSTELAQEMNGFSPAAVVGALPLLLATLLVTALFVTALCMCFCLFAGSFKEANNYLTPVLLVVMFASMVAILPSTHLDYRTALIPIVNVSLLVRQVLAQQFDPGLAGISIMVNFAYSVLIIWVLARLYNSEDVLFSDGFHSLKLFQRRSGFSRGTVPGIGDLVVSFAILLLLVFYLGTAAEVRDSFAGALVNQLLILFVPFAAVWYMKSDVRTLYSLRRPALRICLGGFLLWAGVYLLVLLCSTVLIQFLPESVQNVQTAFDPITQRPFPALLLVIAVLPAVGEEFLFRGFLFGSVRARIGAGWAVVISAFVFAAFHMSLVKFIPTFLLGVSFAVIVRYGGSIFVTAALHFLNNLLSVAALKYPEELAAAIPLLAKETFGTAEAMLMLAAGLALVAVGYLTLRGKSALPVANNSKAL